MINLKSTYEVVAIMILINVKRTIALLGDKKNLKKSNINDTT